jgi:hypothetical protein
MLETDRGLEVRFGFVEAAEHHFELRECSAGCTHAARSAVGGEELTVVRH